jgi:Resolvase, N terminal domain
MSTPPLSVTAPTGTAWARLRADVARRRVDLVMVWKLDRAYRSTLDVLAALRDFEHAGVGFSALTQPELNTTSAAGRLVLTILAAVAEMERELIADRVREGMGHAARQGTRIGRPPVTARPGLVARWPRVAADLAAGQFLPPSGGSPARDRDGHPRPAPGRRVCFGRNHRCLSCPPPRPMRPFAGSWPVDHCPRRPLPPALPCPSGQPATGSTSSVGHTPEAASPAATAGRPRRLGPPMER